ncbi:hypothetical protein bcgnr5384_56380 [Bacillus cereus]
MSKALNDATKNARKRELESQRKKEEKAKSLFEMFASEYEKLTGEKPMIAHRRKQNSKVAFAQIIQHNIQVLAEYNYLTQAEESFLFKISGYLDFKTNVIVEREFKNKSKKEEDEDLQVASVNYIANLLGIHRTNASKMMNSLKKKGILGTGETGMMTEDGRICTSRTWFVNPNVMYCGDKSEIDKTVQIIFKDALKNITLKDGKKIKLPIRLFL